jgi:hypothetical protein
MLFVFNSHLKRSSVWFSFYIRNMSLVVFFCFIFFGAQAYGQDCSRVWVKGRVIDTLQTQMFYNLMVVNRTSGKGVFGQPDGSFAVYVNTGDSITLSVQGYHMVGFRVNPDSLCQFLVDLAIIEKGTDLAEVVIRPLKTLQQVKDERAALALRETRTITGIEAFQSPITALYQRFSKKEQSKAKVAEMEYKDSKEAILQELLRLYVVYDIIELTDEEFLSFIEFLSIDEDFLKTASDMELVTFIKDKFEHYQRIR